MDHATAQFIDIQNNSNRTVKSAFTVDTKGEAFSKSESLMHNKRQQGHETFYKEIAQGILKYNRVLLFGPTNAKTELHNYLNADLHFENIKIATAAADKMSDNEKVAFVKTYFEMKN
jgi:stalled ribosome rescue protein Dom34